MADKIKKVFEISEYREKKELYEACGYKEVVYKEKSGIHCYVTFEADKNMPHYKELKQVANSLKKKGPPFFPTLIFVAIAFALLTVFLLNLISNIHNKTQFDVNNIFYYVIPAGASLLVAVIYTIYYFHKNQEILLEQPLTKEEILKKIEDIKQK